MALQIPGYDPSSSLGRVQATTAAPDASADVGGTDGRASMYFAQQFTNLTQALQGQLQKSEDNAYLNGYVDQQKGVNVKENAPWYSPFTYQEGVSASALHGSIADFQQKAMTKLQDALNQGQSPEQFMESLRPDYSDILDQTKGNMTLADRKQAVFGIRDSIGALGATYRDQYAKKMHVAQLQNGNMAVNQRVRNGIQLQTDPVAFSQNFTSMLDEATGAPGLDDTEKAALTTGGIKAMLDAVPLNFGQRPVVGQFLAREVANHEGIQKLGPKATADILTAVHSFVQDGADRDMAQLHVRLAQATTLVDQGNTFDPHTFDHDANEVEKAMAAGVIKPSDYRSAMAGIEALKQHAIAEETKRARLAGNFDGIMTTKDAKAAFSDGVNAIVKSQFNGDYSHAQEAANAVAVNMLRAGGMAVQPEFADYAQGVIKDRVNLIATTDTSVYGKGKGGAPQFPAPDVALFSGLRDEFQRMQHGQANNWTGMTAQLDSKQQAALQHAMSVTLGSDVQHTLAEFQNTLLREKKGEVVLTTQPDPQLIRDMSYSPSEAADLSRSFFMKHGPVSWGRSAWAGLSNAGNYITQLVSGEKPQGAQIQDSYNTRFATYINGLQRAQVFNIATRDGGLPTGADAGSMRAAVMSGIRQGMVQGEYQTWPMGQPELAVSPQLQKMSPENRGEFIDKVVKDQCVLRGINPDNVLGVQIRAQGSTLQPEIYLKTSDQPVRVNPFNDADVMRFRKEHISYADSARSIAPVKDVSTGRVLNLNLSGRNDVGVAQGEYMDMQKSLLRYEGFASKPYKDPVRGFNIGAGMSDTTGANGMFSQYARFGAASQTPQTLMDLMASSQYGMPQYINNNVKPAVAALSIPWTNPTPLAQATREMFLNVAWQRPGDAVPMAQAINALRLRPGSTKADLQRTLSQFASFRQAHPERQKFYLNTASQLMP